MNVCPPFTPYWKAENAEHPAQKRFEKTNNNDAHLSAICSVESGTGNKHGIM